MSDIKAFKAKDSFAQPQGCADAGGSGKSSRGSSDGPADMAPEVWEKVKNHPFYSEQAHHHYARMHVAVAPACNIQCNYCNRKYDCANESRPGVTSEKLTPEQAAKKVLAVASAIPQVTVLGIAGPGDALANPEKTFKTFELIQATAPDIKLCLSTNGLMLPDHVERIHALNVDHVTINMVDPEVGQHIYPWIFYKNKRWTGRKGGEIAWCLLAQHHAADLFAEHGTVFGLNGQRGPSAQELKSLQDNCEGEMNMMRHCCRQCRADAVGLLGEDRSAEFTAEKVDAMEVTYDASLRLAYQEGVERQRQVGVKAKDLQMAALASTDTDIKIQVAVATKGEGKVNQHFGHASEFQVYELSAAGTKWVGHRRVDLYCQDGYDDEDALPGVIRVINDCHAVLVAKIGGCPREELKQAGIDPVETYAFEAIESSALLYFQSYFSKVASGQIVYRARGDADIRQGAYRAAA